MGINVSEEGAASIYRAETSVPNYSAITQTTTIWTTVTEPFLLLGSHKLLPGAQQSAREAHKHGNSDKPNTQQLSSEYATKSDF